MSGWDIRGINAGYAAELYERFRQNPSSVDPATRAAFERWTPGEPSVAATEPTAQASMRAVVGAVSLADCIRRYGHLAAQLDPLGTPPVGDPSLDVAAHGITDRRSPPAARVARWRAGRRNCRERLRGHRGAAAGLLLDDRLRLRADLRARGTRVAASRGRGRRVPAAGRGRSTRTSYSNASPRSRFSNGSSTAPSPARRASRSRVST